MFWRLIRLCLIIFSCLYCPLAFAGEDEKNFELNIQSRSLDRALLDFGQQTKTPLLFSYEVVKDRISHEVVGSYTTTQAIELLLEGTGLRGKILQEGGVSIEILPQEDKGNTQVINTSQNLEDNKQRRGRNRRTIFASTAALLAGLGNTALAQDAPIATNTVTNVADASSTFQDEPDEVITTGTRIARASNALSAVPLQVISGEQIRGLGAGDISEILAEIPGVVEGISPRGSSNSVQNAGLASIELRRLGDNRTLVLIDGKRAVSNSGNADRVSTDTIPSGLIKDVQLTTGGASAIYGADAIAGVVNFTLEDSFTGFEVNANFSAPDASGGENFRIDSKWGAEFANGRGYILAAGEYRNREAVFADSSRPLSVAAIEFDDPNTAANDAFANEVNAPGCDITNADGSLNGTRFCLVPSFTGFSPGGTFEFGDAFVTRDGQFVNDQGGAFGLTDRPVGVDFFLDFDGADFRTGRSLLGSREITNLALTTGYDLTENVKLNFTGIYSDVQTESTNLAQGVTSNSIFGVAGVNRQAVGSIPAGNPFIPEVVEETRVGGVFFQRRFDEVGDQVIFNDRETIRLYADIEGTIADRFNYEVYGSYGRFDQEQENTNEINLANLQATLRVEDNGSGGFQCIDAEARANGCIPINIFGLNSISTAGADFIRFDAFAENLRTQYTGGGFISGDLFNIQPGTVKFAAGVEYRRESQVSIGEPDQDTVAGGGIDGDPTTPDADFTTTFSFPSQDGSFDVIEAFGELDIPVIEDKISLQLAGRVGDYSTIGTIFSYNVGGVIKPIEGVTFRSQFSRAQRAPTIIEVFSPPRPDSDPIDEPCDGLMSDGTGVDALQSLGTEDIPVSQVSANCLAIPGIQAFFADPANAGEAFDPGNVVNGPNGGNPNVQEETANTFTAGIILEPSNIPNLTLILDYYRISLDDQIGQLESQVIADFCVASANFPNNQFCDLITRDAGSGAILEILGSATNLDSQLVSGIDASLQYNYDPKFVPGAFDLDLRYTRYLKQEQTVFGFNDDLVTLDTLGQFGQAENEFRGRVGYTNGPFRFIYTLTFEEGGIDDIVNDPNPGDDQFFEVDNQYFHRIFGSYTFGQDDNYQIYGGIDNIANNFGPLVPTGVDNGNSRNIITDSNDIRGRVFRIGARARF